MSFVESLLYCFVVAEIEWGSRRTVVTGTGVGLVGGLSVGWCLESNFLFLCGLLLLRLRCLIGFFVCLFVGRVRFLSRS